VAAGCCRYGSLVLRIALFVSVLAVLAAPVAGGTAVPPPCKGAQLAGTFDVIRGSAGAGNISYALVLKNVSKTTCSVTGLPLGHLLGVSGKPVPTRVRPAFPGALAAVLVRLAPGGRARATARFSPDVPGVGEGGGPQCEPVARWFRVSALGGGTTRVPLRPRTPVCEHGLLQFSAYSRAR
jgi:uncharacterized protein DUF4232